MPKARFITAVFLLCGLSICLQAFGLPESGDPGSKSNESNPTAAAGKAGSLGGVGVAVKASTLGIGGDVAVAVSRRSNVRVGFNAFNYSRTFDKDGVTYKGALALRSAQSTFDFFPFAGGFHLSPGVMFYNGNKVTANASVPVGQTLDFDGVTYRSSASNPITGTGSLTLNKVAPMFLFGYGNMVPRSRRHVTYSIEAGVAYQGTPNVKLNFAGSACDVSGLNCVNATSDPTFLSHVTAEQNKLNDSAAPFKFYPIISFGIGYRFGGGGAK